jgi:hypothetical protein
MPMRTTRWAACSLGPNAAPAGPLGANEWALRSKTTPNPIAAAPGRTDPGTDRRRTGDGGALDAVTMGYLRFYR